MKKLLLLSLLAAILLQSCRGLKITYQWKADHISNNPAYHKILVLGLIPAKDGRLQQSMEDHMAGDLTDLGYQATTSLREFGAKAFEGMDEMTVLSKLQNKGIDAVITVVLLNKTREQLYVPAEVMHGDGSSTNFWEYRTGMYNRVFEPGYYVTSTGYFWESNFFTLQDKKLLYSVQTKSFDPQNSWSMGHEYGHTIVSAMVKKKVLVKRIPGNDLE